MKRAAQLAAAQLAALDLAEQAAKLHKRRLQTAERARVKRWLSIGREDLAHVDGYDFETSIAAYRAIMAATITRRMEVKLYREVAERLNETLPETLSDDVVTQYALALAAAKVPAHGRDEVMAVIGQKVVITPASARHFFMLQATRKMALEAVTTHEHRQLMVQAKAARPKWKGKVVVRQSSLVPRVLGTLGYPVQVARKGALVDDAEVNEWVRKHCGPRFRHWYAMQCFDKDDRGLALYGFVDPNHAFSFKMRWG